MKPNPNGPSAVSQVSAAPRYRWAVGSLDDVRSGELLYFDAEIPGGAGAEQAASEAIVEVDSGAYDEIRVPIYISLAKIEVGERSVQISIEPVLNASAVVEEYDHGGDDHTADCFDGGEDCTCRVTAAIMEVLRLRLIDALQIESIENNAAAIRALARG